MPKDDVARMIADALEEMDLREMECVLDTARDALRENIEDLRRRIIERERWDRVPVVLSDFTEPERTREQELASLNSWHDRRMKQLHFVHKLYRVVAEMRSKQEAPAMVAAILANTHRPKPKAKKK